MKTRKGIYFPLIIIVIFLTSAFSSCSRADKEKIIGLNQNIHHDDFEYAVTSFEKTKLIVSGSDTIKASGNFCLVHFRVINKALRVNHQWDNSIGYIIDENGNNFKNNIDYQIFLEKGSPFGWKKMYNTPHGQTDTTILVFDVPANIVQPFLMVRGDILMGDVFDAGKFLKTKVKLF
jgi:hypothetical protein